MSNELDEDELKKRTEIVIEKEGGIWPIFEAFYLESIVYEASRAMNAFSRFDEAVAGNNSANANEIFATAQEALTHTAALSRFFWPSRDGIHKARGKKLRKSFSLTESSPLQYRELRNALEHFDEYLDDFLLRDQAGSFLTQPVIGSDILGESHPIRIFRLVDPKNSTFVLLGEKHEFGPTRLAVDSVLGDALHMLNNGGRLPS